MSYDDDLKKRMALAKSQGWNDDEIQRSALIDRAMNNQKQQTQAKQQQQADQKKQQDQRNGAFSAGNPLGFATSLLPFGEVLRKKLNNESISGGDVALEGVLSALPFAGKLIAKGGKAVAGLIRGAEATKGAKAAETVVKGAAEAPEKQKLIDSVLKGNTQGGVAGKLIKGGEALKAQARGVIPGVKPQGAAEKLLPTQADEINQTLNNVTRKTTAFGKEKKGATGSASNQLRTVQTAQDKARANIDDILSTKNVAISRKDTTDIMKGIHTDSKDILGLKQEHLGELEDLQKRVLGAKDVQDLEKLRKAADARINFSRNPSTPDPALENIYMSLRRNLDKKATELIPELKPAKTEYGKLETAKDTLVQNTPGNMRQMAGQGATSRVMGGNVTQNVVDKAGRALTRAGKIQAAPLTHQAEIRLPFSSASAVGSNQPPQDAGLPQDVQDVFPGTQDPNESMINQLMAGGVSDPQQLTDALTGQGAFSPDQAPEQPRSQQYADMANQALLAGDMKTAKSLMDFAKIAGDFEKNGGGQSSGSGGNVTKVTAQQYGLAQGGAAAVDQLKQMLSGDPGVLNRTATPGRDLPIVGGFISNAVGTGDFDAVGYNIADSILRLRTGATANESEVKKLQSQIMPRAGDSAQTVQTKLQQIQSIFGNVLDLANGPSSGTDMTDFSQLFNQQGAY